MCETWKREEESSHEDHGRKRTHRGQHTPLENQGTRKVVIDSPPLSLSHQRNWAVQYVRFPGGPPPEY